MRLFRESEKSDLGIYWLNLDQVVSFEFDPKTKVMEIALGDGTAHELSGLDAVRLAQLLLDMPGGDWASEDDD